MTHRKIDWRLAEALAIETLVVWGPDLLSRPIATFRPGEVAWWPAGCDGVAIFEGPPLAYIGDWTGRWHRDGRWGRDLITLVAMVRACRPGQAAAYIARAAGVPFEVLTSTGGVQK